MKYKINIAIFALSLFNATGFSEELTITAAQLTGNLTKSNFKHFKKVHYHNPEKCKIPVRLIGTLGKKEIPANTVTVDPIDDEMNTKYALQLLEEAAFFMGVGGFKEVRNSEKYPIPECAYKITGTFSN